MYDDSNHTKGGKVPSTNKLASHKSSRQPRHHVRGSIARFLLSFCGLASFGVVTTLITLSTNNVYAESSSNTITANLPGSVAIRLLDSTGTTEISSLDFNNLTPTPQGTTASKSFIVDVATSNPTGYKLYMQSDYQDSNHNYTTNLTHTDSDVTDVIPTSTTSGSKVYWNYINPLTNSGSSNPTPSVIPPYGTPDKIAQYFSPTNSHQSTIDINVGIDTTIVSGTYENQLLFSAVGNPTMVEYKVTFDPAGGTQTETEIEETAAAGTHSITIPNSSEYIPTKTNYLFDYWQISIPTGSQIVATCNNTSICHPGDNIVISSDEEFKGNVTLNAVYKQDITVISKMQDMTAEICENTAIGTSATLEDTRDNNTYTVKRLNDGNCWMTQNLRLVGPKILTSADSDITNPSTFQLTASTAVEDEWCEEHTANCINQSVVLNDSTTVPYDSSYGVYYNWYAATAGTGTYDMTSGNAISSICPKGWRLPTDGATGEFNYFYEKNYNNYGMVIDNSGPSFTLSGYRVAGSTIYRDRIGAYWSSTAGGHGLAYTFNVYGTDKTIRPAWNNDGYRGFSVRCLTANMSGTLTINPNGGTWSGSMESQDFTQQSGTTKAIADPVGPTYTINYDGNNQGATYDDTPTSVSKSFSGWSVSGFGSIDNGEYTFRSGSGTLTANYSPVSNTFTLPTITKSGYTCDWKAGGNSYASGQSNITITEDTTFVADCTSPAFDGITKMQEMTPTICANNAVGTSKTLTDTRDNKTYTVKKLNDGNCWMTQNLNYTPTNGSTVSSSNTDVASSITYTTSDSSSAHYLTNNCSVANLSKNCVYSSGDSTYGTYYNWYAATAESGTPSTTSGNAQYSICPKGWKMPTGGGYGELGTLIRYYPVTGTGADNQMLNGDPSFILSGYSVDSVISSQGSQGRYWSSTPWTDSDIYTNNLFITDSYVSPSYGNLRHLGFSVRCIVKSMAPSTLVVNPNGGTWNGSTETQTFTQDSGTTKTISNPTTSPVSYNITFDDNGQGATYDTSPSSITTKFTGWALSGDGSFAGGTYGFGTGNGTLVAQYGLPGTESDWFVLPSISKDGHVCKWAEGNIYGEQYTSGTLRTVPENTTYYAVCTSNDFSITEMQQMTPAICANASIGDSATLVDTRDNSVYFIQKLKDGNCWMTQNLKLAGPKTLTSSDSNVSSNYSLPASTTESDDGTTAGVNKWCKDNTLATCVDRSVMLLDTTTEPYNNAYGAYYSWYAATAGTGTYNMEVGDASSSICPKGWRLPRGSSAGEFQGLADQYPVTSGDSIKNQMITGEPSFFLSGRRHMEDPFGRGNEGDYWSSTTGTSTSSPNKYACGLVINNAENIMACGFSRFAGQSVRCIAEGYTVNISSSNATVSYGTTKVQIPYGGSTKVYITPNSNHYLSNVSCPSGYTCSGYTTGISATGTQTVTITNNGGTSGGTVTFTGSPNLQQSCANTATGSTFTYNNVQYIKLKTNSAGTTTACYTKSSQGTATYANAASKCPSGTSVPTQTDFSNLTTAYGTSSALNTATGWGPSTSYTRYWSSTTYNTTNAYYLRVRTSSASVTTYAMTNSINVICKVN